jgi:hypothetical protein
MCPIDIAPRCQQRRPSRACRWFAGALLLLIFPGRAIQAHSASDAYLNLTVDNGSHAGKLLLHGQWDIALRDLDFVLKLDDNGDGRLTWGEVRRHQDAIQRYADTHLAFNGGPGNACVISPMRQLVDDHADGAYAVLLFDVACTRVPVKLTLLYSLFFAIDPSHRGIFVLQNGANTATAVLSPQNDRIDLAL